jgi:hypothetical protein
VTRQPGGADRATAAITWPVPRTAGRHRPTPAAAAHHTRGPRGRTSQMMRAAVTARPRAGQRPLRAGVPAVKEFQ